MARDWRWGEYTFKNVGKDAGGTKTVELCDFRSGRLDLCLVPLVGRVVACDFYLEIISC